MTGIILAGGENSRMGANKAFVIIEGERLIDRTLKIFRDLFKDVIVVTNSPLDYLDLDVTLVTDIYPGKKALGGIYTGLFYATCPHAFVAACDMPYLNQRFIAWMMEQAPAYDLVVPESPDGLEPLHAIYAKSCLPHMQRRIIQDKLKVTGFYKGLKCLTIPAAIQQTFDPENRMFVNVNTREDLDRLTAREA
ncbi:MAG: molybdenum cofactor guanylyltransferase [Deltaproteobacteria bacterium HGW-Deltaproteobacteria-11]|nr:MAG: molybdenum cofactor guanylyltransferase [Deltaproteobacteria bacterium HGW-Deltaproteobacteria-11]